MHGLRDSIRDGISGLLASGPDEAAGKACALLQDAEAYNKMTLECLDYAAQFDWSRRAEEFAGLVEEVMQRSLED